VLLMFGLVMGTLAWAGGKVPVRGTPARRSMASLAVECHNRRVTTDGHACYFGAEVNDRSLTPGSNPRIAPTRFEDWLSHPGAEGGKR
jgi:hypothetical protein